MTPEIPSPPRILHVVASSKWTGQAVPAARLAEGQQLAGAAVLMAGRPDASFERAAREMNLPWEGSVAFRRSWILPLLAGDIMALKRVIRRFRPDVLHAHTSRCHSLALMTCKVLKADDRPLLVRSLHRENPRATAGRRVMFRATDGFMVPSADDTAVFCERYGIPRERTGLISGIIDTSYWKPGRGGERMREKWGVPTDAPVLGIVSRLRRERGIPWLLDAAEDALARVPEAWLVICGRGRYTEEMVERLKSHPARDRIHYAGYVSGQDLIDSYRAFDAALLPRPGNDATCRAALEAMACGKPVVGGRVGALAELLEDEQAGWLAAPDDRQALADAMAEAASDAALRRRKGDAAVELIRTRHAPRAVGEASFAFYRGLSAPGA